MQISELEKAEVLLSDPGSVGPVLAKLKNLKWLQSTWAGTKTISWIRLVLNVITCYSISELTYVCKCIYIRYLSNLQVQV